MMMESNLEVRFSHSFRKRKAWLWCVQVIKQTSFTHPSPSGTSQFTDIVYQKKKKGRRTRSDQGDYNYEYFDLRNPLGNGNKRATTLQPISELKSQNTVNPFRDVLPLSSSTLMDLAAAHYPTKFLAGCLQQPSC